MDAELQELLEAQKASNKAGGTANKKLIKLRKKIQKGEYSTGNNMHDYSLVIAGTLDQDIITRLEGLEQAIKEHQGQQALLLHQNYRREGQDGCFSQSFLTIEGQCLSLGVLDGEIDFRLEEMPRILLPTQKHATLGGPFALRMPYREQWELQPGKISIEPTLWRAPKVQNIVYDVLFGEEVEFFFVAGRTYREEVIEAIKEGRGKGFLKMERALKMVDPEYAKGLELLELPAPLYTRIARDRADKGRQLDLARTIYQAELAGESSKQRVDYAIKLGLQGSQDVFHGKVPGSRVTVGEMITALADKYDLEIKKEK